jgi:lysophospholipase L1-like esterase
MERFEKDWGIGYATYRDLHDSFNDVIRDVARKESVALVDLAAAIPRERTYLYDLVHLNTTGSERVAETVAAALAGLPELTSRAHRGPPTEPAPR